MNGSFRLSVAIVVGLGCLKLVGETPSAPSPNAPNPAARMPFQRIEVFSDGIFQLSGDKKVPETVKSSITGAERALADDEDISSADRKEWKDKCAGSPDFKSSQTCFNAQKQQGLQKQRRALSKKKEDLRSPWQEDNKQGNGMTEE